MKTTCGRSAAAAAAVSRAAARIAVRFTGGPRRRGESPPSVPAGGRRTTKLLGLGELGGLRGRKMRKGGRLGRSFCEARPRTDAGGLQYLQTALTPRRVAR